MNDHGLGTLMFLIWLAGMLVIVSLVAIAKWTRK